MMLSRTILIIGLSSLAPLFLAGCVITLGTAGQGNVVTVKLTQAQMESAVKRVICESNPGTINFRVRKEGPSDTPETVQQIRAVNAWLASFKCPKK